jgi:hypothetical protein
MEPRIIIKKNVSRIRKKTFYLQTLIQPIRTKNLKLKSISSTSKTKENNVKHRKKEIEWNEDTKKRPSCNLQVTNRLHNSNARIHHKEAR